MALPNEPHGFAVNVYTREIHKRHARHAASLRRTTPGGLAGVLHGQDPVLCEECFGPTPKPERKSRTRFTPEPVRVVEKASEPEPQPEPEPEPEAAPQSPASEPDPEPDLSPEKLYAESLKDDGTQDGD